MLVSDLTTLDLARGVGGVCKGVPLKVYYLTAHSAAAIVLNVLASLGVLACLIVLVLVALNRSSPVITSSTLPFIFCHVSGLILG